MYDSPGPAALYGPGLTRARCGQVTARPHIRGGSLPATFGDGDDEEME